MLFWTHRLSLWFSGCCWSPRWPISAPLARWSDRPFAPTVEASRSAAPSNSSPEPWRMDSRDTIVTPPSAPSAAQSLVVRPVTHAGKFAVTSLCLCYYRQTSCSPDPRKQNFCSHRTLWSTCLLFSVSGGFGPERLSRDTLGMRNFKRHASACKGGMNLSLLCSFAI